MRALAGIVGLLAGLAAGGAGAADLAVTGSAGFSTVGAAVGLPAPMLVIVDDEPGVIIRPYWAAPWRHRHYFPAIGHPPRVGRRENLAARYFPKPAHSYHRAWSASSVFESERPQGSATIDADPMQPEPPLK